MTDKIGCKQGFFGRYWMAKVNDTLVCTHMHKTTRAAMNCAKRWLRFQEKVKAFNATNTFVNIQHEETGRMQEWPLIKPMPKGWAKVSEPFQLL